MERHKFFTRIRAADESIDDYVIALTTLSLSCEFSVLREHPVRDIFACVISSKFAKIKQNLLDEGNIKLEKFQN